MSLHVVDRDTVDAFCVACKKEVRVGPDLACPDCGEQIHPLSLPRVPKPATAGSPYETGRALPVAVGERIELPAILATPGRALTLPDRRRIAVQARYLDGAQSIAEPDTWLAIPLRPWKRGNPRGPWPAVVVGRRDGEDVALIMSIRLDGYVSSFPAPTRREPAVAAGAAS